MPPPDPAAPAGEFGFTFDRSGYRVPAIIVSPWVPQGSVFNEEYRHTSLIATLRKAWELGEPFTERDAAARTFDDLFTLDSRATRERWATVTALPVPGVAPRRGGSRQGPQRPRQEHGTRHHRTRPGAGRRAPARARRPRHAEVTPQPILDVFRHVAWHYFPLLSAGAAPGDADEPSR